MQRMEAMQGNTGNNGGGVPCRELDPHRDTHRGLNLCSEMQ